jgi:hypothetical protein
VPDTIVSLPVVSTTPAGYTLQGFEDATFPPGDWQAISNNASNSVTRSSTQAYSGDYSARFASFSSASDYTQYIVTKKFIPSTGDSLTFWYRKSHSSTETFLLVYQPLIQMWLLLPSALA